ncbi:MAG TPA: FprA family A-type flavoprotein [bacterium]|nr:FprA family A-type flavoprotein [bacterium]HQB09869.1 FprA family A-type flavoprotein [bacterium]HQM85797.1 FprA family A-type flavoprotein [bacterium]
MSSNFKAVKVTDSVYWVGAVDWGVRYFHGYSTKSGTTYNAFLIMADKITLIDGVKHGFEKELLERVASVVDPQRIDYIISNHSEPDHSGTIPEIIKAVKPQKVFASKNGVKALKSHFGDMGVEITAVDDGGELSLGNRTLKFMETRMLHWPDSMFTYLVEEEVLFSQDAFGMHYASSERFDDEIPWTKLSEMSAEYYANIITLYSSFVQGLFKKVQTSGLSFKIVAPDHGPVWRNMDNFSKVLGLYQRWSSRTTSRKAVIVYDTMWHATEKMARHIEDGLLSTGVSVKVLPLQSASRSDVATEMLEATAVIVGTPTLNNNLFPSVADALTYLKGLKFQTPFGAAFGSYGWSGEGVSQIKQYLTDMGCEIAGAVNAKYQPDEKVVAECFNLGVEIGNKIINKIK